MEGTYLHSQREQKRKKLVQYLIQVEKLTDYLDIKVYIFFKDA